MDFYISTVSVRYTKVNWFGRKRQVEELVSVGISSGNNYPLIVSIKSLDYYSMPSGVSGVVLNSLRTDHELINWEFDDFDSHLCVSKDKAAALISSYIEHFSTGVDSIYSLRPQDDWHLVRDLVALKDNSAYKLCFSIDQMLFQALYKERVDNLDRADQRNLIRHESFPKGLTTSCKESLRYSFELHKFLKRHA